MSETITINLGRLALAFLPDNYVRPMQIDAAWGIYLCATEEDPIAIDPGRFVAEPGSRRPLRFATREEAEDAAKAFRERVRERAECTR